MSALPAPHEPPPAGSTVSARPCVLVNPRSFQAATHNLARKAAALAQRFGAEAVQLEDRAQLTRELERLRAEGRQRLFVLAGDGTVQGIVQYLAMLPDRSWHPELLVLGGGRSNITANEFGHGSAWRKLGEALRRVSQGAPIAVHERQALRVEHEGHTPQHGFLLAAGAIDAGIRLCEQYRQSGRTWLHRGVLSSPYCLARLAVQVMCGSSPLPPYPELQLHMSNGTRFEGTYRLLVATTLLHRDSAFNPYAARGTGPVRLTAVTAEAARFWRRLPRMLSGHFSDEMNPQQGYLSGRFERIEIRGLGSFSLDGEMFEPDHRHPVILEAGPSLRMLQL